MKWNGTYIKMTESKMAAGSHLGFWDYGKFILVGPHLDLLFRSCGRDLDMVPTFIQKINNHFFLTLLYIMWHRMQFSAKGNALHNSAWQYHHDCLHIGQCHQSFYTSMISWRGHIFIPVVCVRARACVSVGLSDTEHYSSQTNEGLPIWFRWCL